MTNTADGVRKVAESVAAGYGPDIFSGAGSIGDLENAGYSVGHLVNGYVLASGVPVEAGSVLERARGVRDFSDIPVAFRSFASEAAGYVWDGSVASEAVGSVFRHGGFSFGVTPRARWSFGGVPGVDFGEIQRGFTVLAAGVGVRGLGESVGVGGAVLGGLDGPPDGGVVSGAGVGELSCFRFDYDGRGSRMSAVEVSNGLALEQASYWLSRVGGVDAVSPPLVGESPDVVAERVRRVRRVSRGVEGVAAPRLMGVRREVRIMSFVDLFGWVDVRSVMLLLGVSTRGSALRWLRGLQGRGYLESVDVAGSRSHVVWLASRAALDDFGMGSRLFNRKSLGNNEFHHRVLVNYVGAMLVCGKVDVLRLGSLVSGGVSGGGFEVVPDRVVDGSVKARFMGNEGFSTRDSLVADRARELRRWRAAGGVGLSPEFYGTNEWMWAVMSSASESNYHIPDVVVMVPRGEDGAARSVAVEVERGKNKSSKQLRDIIEQYRDDTSVFGQVVWLCTNDRMVRKVNELALDLGCEGRVRAMRLCRPDGSVFDESASVFEF